MGFQHCLAMTAGLITPPLLIGFLCPYETDATCATTQICEYASN